MNTAFCDFLADVNEADAWADRFYERALQTLDAKALTQYEIDHNIPEENRVSVYA